MLVHRFYYLLLSLSLSHVNVEEKKAGTYGGDCWERFSLHAVGITAVDVMKKIFVETRVLRMIRCDLFLSFDFDADLKSNCSGDGRTVSSLL